MDRSFLELELPCQEARQSWKSLDGESCSSHRHTEWVSARDIHGNSCERVTIEDAGQDSFALHHDWDGDEPPRRFDSAAGTCTTKPFNNCLRISGCKSSDTVICGFSQHSRPTSSVSPFNGARTPVIDFGMWLHKSGTVHTWQGNVYVKGDLTNWGIVRDGWSTDLSFELWQDTRTKLVYLSLDGYCLFCYQDVPASPLFVHIWLEPKASVRVELGRPISGLGKLRRKLPRHFGLNRQVLSSTKDGVLKSINRFAEMFLPRSTTVTFTQGHTADIRCFDIGFSNRLMVSGSQDKTMRFWSINDGRFLAKVWLGSGVRCIAILKKPSDALATIVVIFVGLENGEVWKTQTRVEDSELRGTLKSAFPECVAHRVVHSNATRSLQVWNEFLYTASYDMTIRKLLVEDLSQVCLFQQSHIGWINGISLFESGEVLASAADDGFIMFWNCADGQLVYKTSLRGAHEATCIILLRMPSTPTERAASKARTPQMLEDAYSHDHNLIADAPSNLCEIRAFVGSMNGTIHIIDMSGSPIIDLKGHAAGLRIRSLEVVTTSSGEQLLLSASADNTARLWTLSDEGMYQCSHILLRHSDAVWMARFVRVQEGMARERTDLPSREDLFILTCSTDTDAFRWDDLVHRNVETLWTKPAVKFASQYAVVALAWPFNLAIKQVLLIYYCAAGRMQYVSDWRFKGTIFFVFFALTTTCAFVYNVCILTDAFESVSRRAAGIRIKPEFALDNELRDKVKHLQRFLLAIWAFVYFFSKGGLYMETVRLGIQFYNCQGEPPVVIGTSIRCSSITHKIMYWIVTGNLALFVILTLPIALVSGDIETFPFYHEWSWLRRFSVKYNPRTIVSVIRRKVWPYVGPFSLNGKLGFSCVQWLESTAIALTPLISSGGDKRQFWAIVLALCFVVMNIISINCHPPFRFPMLNRLFLLTIAIYGVEQCFRAYPFLLQFAKGSGELRSEDT